MNQRKKKSDTECLAFNFIQTENNNNLKLNEKSYLKPLILISNGTGSHWARPNFFLPFC